MSGRWATDVNMVHSSSLTNMSNGAAGGHTTSMVATLESRSSPHRTLLFLFLI